MQQAKQYHHSNLAPTKNHMAPHVTSLVHMASLGVAGKPAMAEQEKLTRIAIVNGDRCKPKKCRQECKKSCPVVRMGELWLIRIGHKLNMLT